MSENDLWRWLYGCENFPPIGLMCQKSDGRGQLIAMSKDQEQNGVSDSRIESEKSGRRDSRKLNN